MNKVSIIAAIDDKMGIGKDNKLPWYIPEDFRWFKAKTMRKPVVMGRKTHESIGKVLPGRRNIVISRDIRYNPIGNRGYDITDTPSFDNIDIALRAYPKEEEIMIIGGAQIYSLAMPFVDRIYLTRINGDFECDTFFPKIDLNAWNLTFEKDFKDNDHKGTFQILDLK